MASIDNSSASVPIPALLVERATALARAEAGRALVHTRRIAVGAIGALLGTIVACAFAQLALVLLVAWPVLAAHVPLVNLSIGVVASVLISVAAAGVALITWLGVARDRRNGTAPRLSTVPEPLQHSAARQRSASERPQPVELAERMSL